MSYTVSTMNESIDSLSERQILRYMGMKQDADDWQVRSLLREFLPQFLHTVCGKACYLLLPVSICEHVVDFSLFTVESADLARNLHGCEKAAIFAATLGMESEQQRRRAAVVSPMKALAFDAMGSAAIEELCDYVCSEIGEKNPGYRLRPRFSPGYGDFSLEYQRNVLDVLDANRKIGITLSDGMLMIPQKSVTAIVGLSKDGCVKCIPNCEICVSMDCEFRL